MKIRNGFVSNSSSSSFLIITKEVPTVESLYKLMGIIPNTLFGDAFSIHDLEIKTVAGYFEESEMVPKEFFKKYRDWYVYEYVYERGGDLDMRWYPLIKEIISGKEKPGHCLSESHLICREDDPY